MHLELTKPDQILKHFFKQNVYVTPAFSQPDEKNKTMALISFPEGMGLGRLLHNAPIIEMKTFIAAETLNKGQQEMVNYLNDDEKFQEGIKQIAHRD